MSGVVRRLDPTPLLEIARIWGGETRTAQTMGASACSNVQTARVLGVPVRQVQRWLAGTRIPIFTADVLANRLGYHPAEIWGEEWHSIELPPSLARRARSA